MAQIQEQVVVIKVSKLVKDSEKKNLDVLTGDVVENVVAVLEELLKEESVVVETVVE